MKEGETKVTRERVPAFGKPKEVDKLERDGEYQRRCVMSQDERSLDARDRVAKNLHEQNEKDGKNSTFDEALRRVTDIVNKQYRIDQEKGKR